MNLSSFTIKKYEHQYKNAILGVWEQSVLATHDFLSQQDFQTIRTMLHQFDFSRLNVFCLMNGEQLTGFIAIHENKIEMLFLLPEFKGQGLGRYMISFAINEMNASQVDVNEQNEEAVGFYKRMNFETHDRTEKDEMGMNYPILKMKLRK